MTHARSQAELVTLRKLAQDLASARKERLTSVHLLAAIAASPGAAGDLLRDRRLDDEVLLKASRAFDDEGPDPIGRLLAASRQVAMRRLWYTSDASPRAQGEGSPAPAHRPTAAKATARPASPEPTSLHLLLALLSDRGTAAHRSLVQAGVDLARLRTAAMQITLGVVTARRSPSPPSRGVAVEPDPRGRAVAAPARAPVSGRARPSSPPAPITSPPSSGITTPGVTVPFIPPAPALPRLASPRAVAPPSPAPSPSPAPLPASSRPPPASIAPARFALDRARFPSLLAAGQNLTLAAVEGRLDEVVGREPEIEQALDVLAKRHCNCPVFVGPPGVGKTSVARGLARRLAELDGAGEAPPRVLFELALTELVASCDTRRQLADRVAAIRAELREAGGRVILFVDEVHELFAPGMLDEAMTEIKLGLARGDLRLVGATTFEDYRKALESDGGLSRRLSPIEIEEPNEEDAFLLLRSVAAGLGQHHRLAYSDEAIAASVSWSTRYLPGRALPDKAISILDLAGARARRKLSGVAPGAPRPSAEVGPPEVASVVAELADVPVERLLETDRERMLALEETLAERVVGHTTCIARIARVLRRNAAGLRGRRPIGSFLLLGPTGVGKTETAKAVAETLFHSPDAMTRLDFSEYAEAHAVARLIGAPPGYIGHEAGGQLTEAVRKRPYQVILLDEIEKAHRDVLEAFLQVFDEGRLTDGRGRRVDFTNCVMMMTSNLGASEASLVKNERPVGFARSAAPGAAAAAGERLAGAMIGAARAHLPPELYNRIDEVLCFGPLSRAEVAEIARRLLGGLEDQLAARGIRLDVELEVIDELLAAGGFDADLGARPMKRTIARLIENPLAELILRGDLGEGGVALVGVEGHEIIVDAVGAEQAATG